MKLHKISSFVIFLFLYLVTCSEDNGNHLLDEYAETLLKEMDIHINGKIDREQYKKLLHKIIFKEGHDDINEDQIEIFHELISRAGRLLPDDEILVKDLKKYLKTKKLQEMLEEIILMQNNSSAIEDHFHWIHDDL
jgi:hypothetical protein